MAYRERERRVAQRPELFKLLDACEDGDVLLIEQVTGCHD